MVYGYTCACGAEFATQHQQLFSAGCVEVVSDAPSGGDESDYPARLALLQQLQNDDVLIVPRLDQLAVTVGVLRQRIEALLAQGVQLKSLYEAIDSKADSYHFTVELVRIMAEFERQR